jgi:hypothetical protein
MAAAALAACSESPNAPARPGITSNTVSFDRHNSGHQGSDRRGRPESDDWRGDREDGNKGSVTVDPTVATTITFGNHQVYFPANSICDPAAPGYSDQQWDSPCAVLQTPIVISATWTNKMNSHAAIDFEPALRFAPSSDQSQWVMLSMREQVRIGKSKGNSLLWFDPALAKWVDEALDDNSMSSSTDLDKNTVSRRIKHFSGYNLATGLDGTAPVDASLSLGW